MCLGRDHMNPIIRLETITDETAVQIEVLNLDQDVREIDALIDQVSCEISCLNDEKNILMSQADWFDISLAVSSGILCAAIDSVWVGEFSFERAHEWGSKKVDSFVVRIAKLQGYKGDDLQGAVTFLEKNHPIPADKATSIFGGGKQHHLRDFAHHPNTVGLFFSMLTQFTGIVYGTDVTGRFIIQDLPDDGNKLIGKGFHEKVLLGSVHWFFHMVSDMAGSSSSIAQGKEGTGLPGPIVSFLKEVSVLPFFQNLDEKGYREFSVWISRLFNGTLLAKRDKEGNLEKAIPFDLRTEIGMLHELGRQAIPVIINECIVRGFYFIRKLVDELKYVHSISNLKRIEWKNTLPIKNPTIVRMLLISNATFVAVDLADASIRAAISSSGDLAKLLRQLALRVNFVGIGRVTIALGYEAMLNGERNKVDARLDELKTRMTLLKASKVYYSIGQSWQLVFDAEQAIDKLSSSITDLIQQYDESMNNGSRMMASINQNAEGFISHNSDTAKAIIDLLDEV